MRNKTRNISETDLAFSYEYEKHHVAAWRLGCWEYSENALRMEKRMCNIPLN